MYVLHKSLHAGRPRRRRTQAQLAPHGIHYCIFIQVTGNAKAIMLKHLPLLPNMQFVLFLIAAEACLDIHVIDLWYAWELHSLK